MTRSLWRTNKNLFPRLLGKGHTDLFFCLKKLALFWLSPRSKRTIVIERNGRSNHERCDTKARRESFSNRSDSLHSRSVYRAPLEGIGNVCKENFRDLLSFFRVSVFPLCFDPSWNLELISGWNSIRFEGNYLSARSDRPILRYKSRGGTRADVTISSVPWKPGDRWCNYVKRAHRVVWASDQLRLRVL